MMLKIGLMLIALLGFVGCGGSGGSSSDGIESVSNSTLKSGDNELGYYGKDVKFGNHTVARKWTFTKEGETPFLLIFSTGDAGYHVESGDINSFDFGVSDNAKIAKVDLLGSVITLTLTSVVDANCYNVTLTSTGSSDKITALTCAEE